MAAGKRGPRFRIETLDKRIVDTANQLIKDGHTIDEIVLKLQELGADVSRSAVGRYVKNANASMETYKKAQAVAKVWADKMENDPDGDLSQLLIQLLSTVAFQTVSTMGDAEKPAKAMDVMLLSQAIKNLSSTSKTKLDIAVIRKRIQAEAQATAKEFESQARKSDMPEAVIQNTMARILGISEAGA